MLLRTMRRIRYRTILQGEVCALTTRNQFLFNVLYDSSNSSQQQSTAHDDNSKVAFDFALQDKVDQGIQEKDYFLQRLLPSTTSRCSKQHWSKAFETEGASRYQVSYAVIASVFLGKKVMASSTGQFNYFPCMPAPKAFPIEDFDQEYILRTMRVLRSCPVATRIGIISQEPASIALNAETKMMSTKIDLLLMLVRNHTSVHHRLPTKCTIQAFLRTLTFVMREPAGPSAHTLQSNTYAKAATRSDKTCIQTQTLHLKQWDSNDSESEGKLSTQALIELMLTTPPPDEKDTSSTEEEVFTKAISFPFTIDVKHRDLIPSFWSPLLSRRYIIEMSVMFDDADAGTLKLKVPLQVYHEF